MPDEDVSCTPHAQLMSPEEIFQLASVFVQQGVRKIRLTGGEPLVRKEFPEILQRLSTLGAELTLTTNGVLLDRHLPLILESGIRSLNISLDTRDPDRFMLLTRRDNMQQVLDNIQRCLAAGLHVKINMVVMRGINEHEIPAFTDWSVREPLHIRFIEFMPFTGNHWHHDKVFPLDDIIRVAGTGRQLIPLGKEPHATARKYFVPGAAGSLAVISTMSHPFCGDCNRLRLTADGKMRNCLFATGETDLLGPLRRGEEVLPLIHSNLAAKKARLGGQFDEHFENLDPDTLQNRSMIAIGG